MNIVIHRPDLGPAFTSPRPGDKALSLLVAMRRWTHAGCPLAPGRVRKIRSAICSACHHWSGLGNIGLGECRAPGCGCTRAKVWLATEACPLGKWKAVATQ